MKTERTTTLVMQDRSMLGMDIRPGDFLSFQPVENVTEPKHGRVVLVIDRTNGGAGQMHVRRLQHTETGFTVQTLPEGGSGHTQPVDGDTLRVIAECVLQTRQYVWH